MVSSNKTPEKATEEKEKVGGVVVVQKWEESERGWGTRPDGFSIHESEPHRAMYVEQYWKSMPDAAPDEYSRPDGMPYTAHVDEETYALLAKARGDGRLGVRISGKPYPGTGGPDGWK